MHGVSNNTDQVIHMQLNIGKLNIWADTRILILYSSSVTYQPLRLHVQKSHQNMSYSRPLKVSAHPC